MANVDAPNGFTPVRHLTGGIIRMEELPLASATAASIFSGDVVTLAATGYISVGLVGSTQLVGVFAGCSYTAADGTPVFSKMWTGGTVTDGSADAVAYVYSDPSIVFAAQTSGTAAFADNGAFQDLTATAGDTSTGRSRQEVDETTNTTNVFRQIGLVKKPDNAWGANAEIEVVIALHAYNQPAGVAV
jgi:hypothetical protein